MAEPRKPAHSSAVDRERRRAEALRANLRRRKEQARETADSADSKQADAPLPPQSFR